MTVNLVLREDIQLTLQLHKIVISVRGGNTALSKVPFRLILVYHAVGLDKATTKIQPLVLIVEQDVIIQHLEELVLLAARGRRPHLLRQ